MPHQCVKCEKRYPEDAKEILLGCECGNKSFLFLRCHERMRKNEHARQQVKRTVIEKVGHTSPHSVFDSRYLKVQEDGKYEIDVAHLFSKKESHPVQNVGEGKYEIDIQALGRKTNL